MKLSKIFGFVLLATLVVALSGNMSRTGYAIPTGGPDFAYASATSYIGGATSLPVNPGMTDQVIGVFVLRDCANNAPGAVTLASGTRIPAFPVALCPAVPADTNPSNIVRMEVVQVGGSAPAGTFTNVRAYLDTELPAVPVGGGVGGVFNKFSDQLLGTFTGDIATGATLQAAGAVIMQIPHAATGVTKLVYIVADVSPSAQLGVTAVLGLTVQTDNVDLGGGPVVSSQTSSGVTPPVQSVLQVAVGAAQTGTARGVAADVTTQVNVVTNITPTVPAGVQQIMQIIAICAEAVNVVPAPSSGGSIFIGTLYPQCVSPGAAANGAGLAVQQLVIQKLAGSLPNATVHVYVDRNGNNLPDSSEEIGLGFPWPDTNTPLVLGRAGNAFLAGPAVAPLAAAPILTAAGLITSPVVAGGGNGGNECGAANLLAPSNAASALGCGINLIITLESASSGDIQIGTTINAGDIPRLGAAFVGTNVFQTPMPVRSLVRATFQGAGGPPPGPTTATLVANVGKAPKKPAKSMTYKDVFVSATGPAGASKALTGFFVPGCTVTKVTGPALPVTVSVGGAPVGPFKVKVKCATKPATVPGLTPLRVGGDDGGVPSLIPLRAGSVGTVEVFTLTGKKVLETGFSGGALDATKLDLPNGVYLYVVTMQTPEGIVRSELRKLVIKH